MNEKKKIAKRYAKAFLNEKAGKEEIELLAEEMRAFVQAVEGDKEAMEFFVSPAVPTRVKLKVAGNIARKLGFSPYTGSLIELLIRKGRFGIVSSVAEELQTIADRLHGRVRVTVTTAVEPSVEDIELIAERVSGFFGRKTVVNRKIDPSIIGGFILEGEGKLVDMSVRGQLRRLLSRI